MKTANIPDHVPSHLVYDYDFFETPAQFDSPQWGVSKKLQVEAPRIFYTPRNGGHWVVSRRSDILEMFRHPELFPNDPEYNAFRRQNPMRFLPKDYDPPEHTELRGIISPLFMPTAVVKMEPGIRQLAIELIEGPLTRGQCEFVGEIAERFPVTVFLQMANAPLDRREAMLELSHDFFRSPDPARSRSAMTELGQLLRDLIEQRRGAPGDDLLSRIVTGTFKGRPLTPEEMVGGAVFTFLAGLDTVSALMSFALKLLAWNPELYQKLVENPERIGPSVEELIRVSGVAMPERGVKEDVVFRGVPFKRNDRIIVLLQISGMDPDAIEDPWRVDIERKLSPHLVFGAGPHRCLGAHLARVELRIFLEEWVRRVPAFQIAEGHEVTVRGGTVWLPAALPLTWTLEVASGSSSKH